MKYTIDWDNVYDEIVFKEACLQRLIGNIEKYVKEVLQTQFVGKDVGLVYNKLYIDVVEHGRFMIWISESNGLYVQHKFIDIPNELYV